MKTQKQLVIRINPDFKLSYRTTYTIFNLFFLLKWRQWVDDYNTHNTILQKCITLLQLPTCESRQCKKLQNYQLKTSVMTRDWNCTSR